MVDKNLEEKVKPKDDLLARAFEGMNRDLPDVKITGSTVDTTKKASIVYPTSMRQATGRVWPTADYERRRRRVLDTPLP